MLSASPPRKMLPRAITVCAAASSQPPESSTSPLVWSPEGKWTSIRTAASTAGARDQLSQPAPFPSIAADAVAPAPIPGARPLFLPPARTVRAAGRDIHDGVPRAGLLVGHIH